MVKNPLLKTAAKDARRSEAQFGGPWVVPGPGAEDNKGHVNSEDGGQTNWCRQPLLVSQTPTDPYDTPFQTWATVSLNQRRSLCFDTSPNLKQHQHELFKHEFCQNFLHFANLQEHGPHISVRVEPPNYDVDPDHEVGVPIDRRPCDISLLGHTRSSKAAVSTSSKKRKSSVARGNFALWSPHTSSDSGSEVKTGEEYDEVQGGGTKYETIRIDDEQALEKYYQKMFTLIQQLKCRDIARVWADYIEPGKRVEHPYNGRRRRRVNNRRGRQGEPYQGQPEIEIIGEPNGELTKPAWWPPQGCPHTGPCHLKKDQRLVLLIHLLRHARDWKESLTSDKLKEVTDQLPLEPKQRRYLNDIYRVAKMEERLLRQEIDPETTVMVEVPEQRPSKRKNPRISGNSTRARVQAPDRQPRSRDDIITACTPSSSLQQSPSEFISPIGDVELRGQRQDQFYDQGFSDVQVISASVMQRGDLIHPLRPRLLSQYSSMAPIDNDGRQTQYRAQAPVTSQETYMITQPAIEPPNLEFVPRGPSFAFAVPEVSQTSDRERMKQSVLTPQPHPIQYNSWTSPAVNQVYPSQSPWNYSLAPAQSPQSVVQNPFQRLPAGNGDLDMPRLPQQQPTHAPLPDVAASRSFSNLIDATEPANSLGTGSFDQSHHGLPADDFNGYQMDTNHFDSR